MRGRDVLERSGARFIGETTGGEGCRLPRQTIEIGDVTAFEMAHDNPPTGTRRRGRRHLDARVVQEPNSQQFKRPTLQRLAGVGILVPVEVHT